MDVDVGELDALVVRVRADTSGFMAGLTDIRRELEGPLAQGAERAGGGIERSLARAAVRLSDGDGASIEISVAQISQAVGPGYSVSAGLALN